MLYLNPPYYVINGVSIFPDHADPLQFYYLPMMPHLTMVKDADGDDVPQIQLIEYEGAVGTGGFIDFDVNIGMDDSVLNNVKAQLRRQANLSDDPRLSPITFVDGSVRLLLLGAESDIPTAGAVHPAAAPAPSAPAGAPKFVIKIESAAKPALYGDNQATFSVQLDQYGATILEQALKGEIVPIAVIYSLDFLALRPAFNVHLHIDWDRVQTHLDQQFSASVLFFSSDIEKAVDKLIEDQVITIQVDTFVADSDSASHSVGSDRDRAVSECYELIKNTFFQSSLPPPKDGPDDWDKAMGVYRQVSDIALTGGWAATASFSYKKVDLSRTDVKKLDFNVSERTAVVRTIYPQGHLSGLLAVLKRGGIDPARFILKVDLDNPWFQRRRATVVSHADFAGDSIASIDVNLKYNNQVKSITLDGSNAQGMLEWSSVIVGGQMVRPITYTYTVNFKNADTTQRPGALTSVEKTAVGDVIDIEPRNDLYAIMVVPIRADRVPWDRYPSVEVECRYVDDAHGIHLQASALLSSQNPELTWPLFMRDVTRRQFDYRLTFSLATGTTTVTPWATTGDGKVDINDPFPSKLDLLVIPALDWNTFDEAIVFLAYPDHDNPAVQQTYAFTKANAAAQHFIAERQDAGETLIYFEAKLIRKNGQIWSIPGSMISGSMLAIQDGMKGHQIVTVKPEAVDFAAKRIGEIDVQLRYVDAKNNLNAASKFTLATASDARSFAFDYLDPSISPEYRADIQLDNGETKNIDWTPIAAGTLTIPLSQLD